MILNGDCFELIKNIKSKSIDLILIDPPYLISKKSNFKNYSKSSSKDMITKYGKVSIDFGKWDKIIIDWDFLFKEYYRILKKGGTLIIFYDIWKSNELKEMAEKYKFKQPRVCKWEKTNPLPVNSKVNYLSNSTEYFFTFTKGGKPTFNSEYDNGVYRYPLCHGKERLNHPTQKPLKLINDLIIKHSNVGDVILDNFAGTFTTSVAADNSNRSCISIERDIIYFEIGKKRVNSNRINLGLDPFD